MPKIPTPSHHLNQPGLLIPDRLRSWIHALGTRILTLLSVFLSRNRDLSDLPMCFFSLHLSNFDEPVLTVFCSWLTYVELGVIGHSLQDSTCTFRDAFLLITIVYLSYCNVSGSSNQSGHTFLTFFINKAFLPLTGSHCMFILYYTV